MRSALHLSRVASIIAATLLAIGITGCSSDDPSDPSGGTNTVASVSISPPDLSITVGQTGTLTATNLANCWGLNSSGQGGVGPQMGNLSPSPVRAPTNQ